jgi:hypothetical protein
MGSSLNQKVVVMPKVHQNVLRVFVVKNLDKSKQQSAESGHIIIKYNNRFCVENGM